MLGQKLGRRIFLDRGNGQKNMLCRNKFILERFRSNERALQDFVGCRAQMLLRRAGHFRETPHPFFDLARQGFRAHAQTRQQRRHDPVVLRHERAQ